MPAIGAGSGGHTSPGLLAFCLLSFCPRRDRGLMGGRKRRKNQRGPSLGRIRYRFAALRCIKINVSRAQC
jgi:hypothetical protein